MLISSKFKFIFVANTKAASTSIEHYLRDFADIQVSEVPEQKHMPYYKILDEYSGFLKEHGGQDEFMTFGVFRHPISWINSWYRYRIGNEDIEAYINEDLTFKEFFLKGDWNIWLNKSEAVPLLQKRLFEDPTTGNIMVDRLLRFEHLSSDLGKLLKELGIEVEKDLGHLNRSKLQNKDDIDDEFSRLLRNHYHEDFKIWRGLN